MPNSLSPPISRFLRGASKAEELVSRAPNSASLASALRIATRLPASCGRRTIRTSDREREELQRSLRSCQDRSKDCCRRALGFRRRHSRHSGLSAESRRLGSAHPIADGRQEIAPKRAIAFLGCRICWNMRKASISLSCRRRGSMPSGLAALVRRLKEAALAVSVWLAARMLYRGDDARRLARLAEIARDASRSADRGQ